MRPMDLRALLRDGTLDPQLTALLWLLIEYGVPLVVAGDVDEPVRAALASSLLSVDPAREWLVLDADAERLTAERLTALLRGGVGFGVVMAAPDLEGVLDRLVDEGLPEDGVRRLGVVVIVEEREPGLRCPVVHYLRPTERDGQGHLQRRPPALLASWDGAVDAYEDYAWGITPELADRVDRSQADLEERRAERAAFLAAAAVDDASEDEHAARVRRYLEAEPERTPAPQHEAATPSPFSGGLTDPDPDPHVH